MNQPQPALIGILRLLRLSNSLSASGLVLVGAKLSGGWPFSTRIWLAASAMWFVTTFGYTSNDLGDVAEDRINKPDRPLPSGTVSPTLAKSLMLCLAATALMIASLLGWRETLVALAVLSLLTGYNAALKSTPGGGNLLIGILASGTLVTGSVATLGFTWQVLNFVGLPALLLLLFITGREAIKTLEDVEGDRSAQKQTIALRLGAQKLLGRLITIVLLIAGIGLFSWRWLGYDPRYFVILMAGVEAPLIFTLRYLWQDANPQRVSRCLALLKASYFAGILALLFA